MRQFLVNEMTIRPKTSTCQYSTCEAFNQVIGNTDRCPKGYHSTHSILDLIVRSTDSSPHREQVSVFICGSNNFIEFICNVLLIQEAVLLDSLRRIYEWAAAVLLQVERYRRVGKKPQSRIFDSNGYVGLIFFCFVKSAA